ncbi:MAG: hypothetical protein KF746_17660 [Chitinophagaceae bacterium]|nr:hypothetical protein [Chitinophagaceae bacterium]
MCKTTTNNTASADRVRRIFPQCAEEVAGKKVKVAIYDPKKIIDGRNDLKAALMGVQNFYNSLKDMPGLSPDLSNDLALYTFEVTYKSFSPAGDEIQRMGRMDFPFYVFNTPGLSANSTSADEIQRLMEKHQVASYIWLRKIEDDPSAQTLVPTRDVYKGIEEDWSAENVLGFGFAGNYYLGKFCRKLGIIKADAVLKNITGWSSGADKFKSVVEHELGHMFSLTHHSGTVMNETYQPGTTQFSVAQIDIIRDTLKILSP